MPNWAIHWDKSARAQVSLDVSINRMASSRLANLSTIVNRHLNPRDNGSSPTMYTLICWKRPCSTAKQCLGVLVNFGCLAWDASSGPDANLLADAAPYKLGCKQVLCCTYWRVWQVVKCIKNLACENVTQERGVCGTKSDVVKRQTESAVKKVPTWSLPFALLTWRNSGCLMRCCGWWLMTACQPWRFSQLCVWHTVYSETTVW